ncbi:MAG: hypothetical protein HY719_18055 [Planctomycetes bacterium]|nr:hypothetical protein [Planctomycetota bacterium]
MARDFYLDVVDPARPAGARVRAKIPGDIYLRHYKFQEVKYWNLVPAREVLLSPLLIFEGIREF